MNVSIDFEKSVRRKRLIYHGTGRQKLILALRNFMSGIITLFLLLAVLCLATYFEAPDIVFIILWLFTLLIVISMILQNRFATARTSHPEEDQHAIIRFLLRKYPGIIRHNCSEQVIIITSPRPSTFNKEYLILQHGDQIYMNISRYSPGNLKYVFLSIPQYLASRSVLKNFRNTVFGPGDVR